MLAFVNGLVYRARITRTHTDTCGLPHIHTGSPRQSACAIVKCKLMTPNSALPAAPTANTSAPRDVCACVERK